MATLGIHEDRAGCKKARIKHGIERNTRLAAPCRRNRDGGIIKRFDRRNALARRVGIAFLALDPDKVPPQFLGNSARGARPEKRIKHHITGVGTR